MFNKLKNAEWSKRLLVFLEIMLILSFIMVCVAVFKGMSEALTAWIAGLYSLASIAFGFYYWKAKNENIRKYSKKLNPEDIEKVAKCYDAIFKEVNSHE